MNALRRSSALLAAVWLCGAVDVFADFEGRLEEALETSGFQRVVLEAGGTLPPGAELPCAGTGRCYQGTLELPRLAYLLEGAKVAIVLVERTDGPPALYVDVNRDGAITPEETGLLHPTSAGATTWDTVLRFPAPKAPGGSFARLFRLEPSEAGSSQRRLQVTAEVSLRGSVEIDGRPVRVKVPYDLDHDAVQLREGYLGIDGDGDGKIDRSSVSPESAYARGEDLVFRVGSRYLSVKVADPQSRVLVLRERSSADYARIELSLGATIPDFAFRDSTGTTRRLYDLRSRYTLLFLWGLGCGAWDSDVPIYNSALARFGGAAVSIVGISDATDDVVIRNRLAPLGANWIQVAAAEGSELYSNRFRVLDSPTVVLIDSEHRILSRNMPGELPLRDAGFLDTLKNLLGKPAGDSAVQQAP